MHNVNYLISGKAYLPYLATSCYTLRHHFDGHVNFFAWPESYDLALTIARNPAIKAKVIQVSPRFYKNGHLLQKIEIVTGLPGTNLLLDADTLVVNDVADIFRLTDYSGYTATQFCGWTTQQRAIQNRLKRMEPFLDEKEKGWLAELLNGEYPSLNCGVFAAKGDTVLKYWMELSQRVQSIFIPDECAQHLLQKAFPISVLTGGEWNASPKYKKEKFATIWHGHGNMFARPEKCEYAVELWLSHFAQALKSIRMQPWIESCGNGRLTELLRSKGYISASV